DQLAWILLDYEKMDQALELAWQNYQIYPQSRFFLWTLVEIYYRSGKWDKAYPLYEKLLSLCRQDPESNHYNEIGCLVRMAEIRYEKGDYTAASSLADEVIRLDINEEVRQHTRSKREKAQQIKKESLQELTELRRLTH
ncbi:tetratricopeptide repeat protein, partial [Candidatus Saccharibacteria bacterium]|nr:tetratricopeptide repeat protein [Candidatus Saccharibacteria bacterium]NIW78276.1 tetratricopeptide repeat protein [Calditrichia bacterium]